MWLATGLHHETETGNEIALLRLKMIFVNGLTRYWYINIAISVSLREIVTGLLTRKPIRREIITEVSRNSINKV